MPGIAENRIARLHQYGQSPWLDHISRDLVARGGLKRMVEADRLAGVTTNPAIFARAVAAGAAYDEEIVSLAHQGLDAAAIFDRLAIDDVRAACDVLAPVYLGSGGEDGFVSIEVSPHLAHDTAATVAEAHRLFAAVDRPNVMVKIPGTREGAPAVLQTVRDGLNVNVTLLFTVSQYAAVAEAYIEALEDRLQAGLTVRATSSVASLFVSRVDVLVDALLEEQVAAADATGRRRLESLRGRAGVANAKLVYERFRSVLNGREWQLLAASGAKAQRLLWASTGTKDPAYPDTLYVDELIGEHTVNTMPEATWRAFRDHGTPARTVDRHLDEAHRVMRELGHAGADVERLGIRLQHEGVEQFAEAYDAVVATVDEKRQALHTAEGG
jgi:transaldolase